jgi:hypothetical protein
MLDPRPIRAATRRRNEMLTTPRAPFDWKRCGAALGVCAALSLAQAAAAPAQSPSYAPPAPGNLIANGGFDMGTAGWGSFGGTLARSENGSLCWSMVPGAATVTRRTGSVYTISDSQGGHQPTVRSTVAGESFVAYATVAAASPSAAGKPARIILRERVGTTGAIIKETATSFTLLPSDQSAYVAVSAQAVRSGSTLGLRIEQSGAQAGDAFTVDDVYLRRATPEFGSETPGTIWTRVSSDISRVSTFSAAGADGRPDTLHRYLERVRVHLDGRGGATGSQKLRAVVYIGVGSYFTAPLWATSREVTVSSGASARWVDFRFDEPVRLPANDGASYQFGLLSGGKANVARYAATAAPAALQWGPDRYADGASPYFGTTDPQTDPTWSTDGKQMSIQGISAPIAETHPLSCF